MTVRQQLSIARVLNIQDNSKTANLKMEIIIDVSAIVTTDFFKKENFSIVNILANRC